MSVKLAFPFLVIVLFLLVVIIFISFLWVSWKGTRKWSKIRTFLPQHVQSFQNDQLAHLSISTSDHFGIPDPLKNLVEPIDLLLRKKAPCKSIIQ